MIHEIFWNYFESGVHLVIMESGREHRLTSGQLIADFTLGHLTKRER